MYDVVFVSISYVFALALVLELGAFQEKRLGCVQPTTPGWGEV